MRRVLEMGRSSRS